jgi:hypothetical protein
MFLSAIAVNKSARALPISKTGFHGDNKGNMSAHHGHNKGNVSAHHGHNEGNMSAHHRMFTVLLIVRSKSRQMVNAHELISALQRASMGLQWAENVAAVAMSSDLVKSGNKTIQHRPSAENKRIIRKAHPAPQRNPNRSRAPKSLLPQSSIVNKVVNSRRKLDNRDLNLSFVPKEAIDNSPGFHLQIFNDSALPKTQVSPFAAYVVIPANFNFCVLR